MSLTDVQPDLNSGQAANGSAPADAAPATPDALETALREVLPDKHTCWTTQTVGAELPKKVTDKLNEVLQQRFGPDAEVNIEVIGLGGSKQKYRRAAWANETGLWSIAFCQGHGDEPVYDVSIDAPEIDITLRKMTVSRSLNLLRALGALD